MQISDLVGQYNQALSAGAEPLPGTKGVENLVSSLKSLTKGNIFEGTVSSMKNGRVTLSLAGGTQLSARLDGKVSLSEGQSMFFQVKSNDGTTIAIRPFVVDGAGVNYTLMQALSAAGLPAEAGYLSMVDKMMEEQMPIDRASLQQMARLAGSHTGIDVRTLVQMTKLGIGLTPENAAQFENYLGDRQAITAAIDTLIDELPMAMQGSGLSDNGVRQMNAQLLSVITEGLSEQGADAAVVQENAEGGAPAAAGDSAAAGAQTDALADPQPEADARIAANPLLSAAAATNEGTELVMPSAVTAEGLPIENGQGQTMPSAAARTGENAAAEDPAEPVSDPAEAYSAPAAKPSASAPAAEPSASAPAHSLAAVLDEGQREVLNDMLKGLVGQEGLRYDGNRPVSVLLTDLKELLDSGLPVDRGRLQQLFTSNEFKTLVKDTLERQWTLRPEELTGSDRINRLYEKLENHMNRIGDVLRAAGQENTGFTQTAADIRSNVDFMNQINQAYTYVQIPLKMSGQTASGELYVYTNKKALAEGDRELTAFLHLDMDHLGPTDISVRLMNREVSTNFYLENDAAYALIGEHLPILEARLREKGYNCKVSVINENHHVNFVEDFLKKDQPSAGQMHRYSFDMRA